MPNWKKSKGFQLTSGNQPSFKMLGAEPENNTSDASKEPLSETAETPMEFMIGPGAIAARSFGATRTDLPMQTASSIALRSGQKPMDRLRNIIPAHRFRPAFRKMDESPNKLTQDAVMKMTAAMKRRYNQD